MAKELLDIVNDEDIVIGKESRVVIHQLGLQHRGAHVFLFTIDEKMLVQKRSADRAASPSLLDCSISEHVQAGESYLEAAIRGMKEEMGVAGIQIKPLFKFKMNYGINDNEISELYEGIVDSTQVKFDPVEIESIQYLSLDEIKEIMNTDSNRFCGWFIEILNCYLDKPSSKLKVLKKY